MLLKSSLLVVACFSYLSMLSQSQRIQQQKCFGGNNYEEALGAGTLVDNHDGTFIISGTTNSYNNGDIIGGYNSPTGGRNFFIAKIDSHFNFIWKTIIGGEYGTILSQILPSPAGGYILIGTSYVGGGDVTGNHGQDDVWVVKMSANGEIEWQRSYGGNTTDQGNSIVPDGNGGYVFIASTVSQDGDVVGFHATANYGGGGSDVWMVHINATGDILSQKCLGGIYDETGRKIIKTSDGNYLIAASANGNDGDVSGVHVNSTLSDCWLIKVTSSGTIIWSKVFGGTGTDFINTILEISDGDYLVMAGTQSIDGDVTGAHQKNTDDAWVLYFQADGQLVWKKCFGGVDHDDLFDVMELPDHSFMGTGLTYSNNSGDVGTNNGGYCDVWVLRFSSQGEVMWGNTYGGPDMEYGADICLTSDNGAIVIATSYSNTHDVAGNHGGGDIWVFKLGNQNNLSGNVFFDTNKNGVKDAGEQPINQVRIDATRHTGAVTSAIPSAGHYSINLDSGVYQIKTMPVQPLFNAVPSASTVVFPGILESKTLDIAVQSSTVFTDINVSLVALTPARTGFNTVYSVIYSNEGSVDITDAVLDYIADARASFVSSSLTPSIITGQHISWHIPIIHAQESGSFTITLKNGVPPVLQRDDVLSLQVSATPVAGDINVHNDTARLQQIVTGAYDPNDKQEANGGKITKQQLEAGEYLTYLIRFQNTGNDLAYNITVTDTLDDKLDWSSLQMTTCSHPYSLQITEGNKLSWYFDNIQLADSVHNEPASHGYIGYKIKPKPGLVEGDVINNKASIYFDFNLPVATNRQQTMLLSAVALPVTLLHWDAVYKNAAVQLTWQTTSEININYFQVQYSPDGIHFNAVGNVMPHNTSGSFFYTLNHSGYISGNNYYRLATIDLDGHIRYSTILIVRVANNLITTAEVYPNPASNVINVLYSGPLYGKAVTRLFDWSGKEIYIISSGSLNAGSYSSSINIESLARGIYFIECSIGNFTDRKKIIIQ